MIDGNTTAIDSMRALLIRIHSSVFNAVITKPKSYLRNANDSYHELISLHHNFIILMYIKM